MSDSNQDIPLANHILHLEKEWANAIQARDRAATDHFLADSYFLAIAVSGASFQIMPRERWLESLAEYIIRELVIEDQRVHVYGDTAVVLMIWNQNATVGGKDRTGVFCITDIWTKQENGWRVAERHSSRPEPSAAARPQ